MTLASAEQLVAELTTTGVSVDSNVMRQHDAIARVLNPAISADGNPLTWSSFARDEFELTSDLQWRNVVDGLRLEGIDPPLTGSVDPRVVRALLDLLPASDSGEICVAQWDGYADVEWPTSAQAFIFPPARESLIWSVQIRDLPHLERVPMRWWHPDLRWVVGNDIYGRSVFVSAATDVVAAILASPHLEAFRVDARDPVRAEDF